jgi:hypothetical protein
MRPDRSWLSQLIIQPLMIVLSILAALAVNQWQESRARTQRVDHALNDFVIEIRANRELLRSDKYLPHHRRLRLEYAQIVKGEIADKNSFFATGVHPTPLRDSAWRVLSGTAVLMDLKPEIVLALSDIYHAQDSLEKRNDGFLNAITAPRSDRETPAYVKDVASSITMYLNDLVPAEESLDASYEPALPKLLSPGAPDWSGAKAADSH